MPEYKQVKIDMALKLKYKYIIANVGLETIFSTLFSC